MEIWIVPELVPAIRRIAAGIDLLAMRKAAAGGDPLSRNQRLDLARLGDDPTGRWPDWAMTRLGDDPTGR